MTTWGWSLFAVYLTVTAFLAWRGGRKTTGKASFAIGSGRMNPWMAGLTLGACTASSSLFVIMPGFVVVVGCAKVLQSSLGVPYEIGVVGTVVFVFGYTALGGAWAHALTNSAQGAIMLMLALVIFASGLKWWLDGSLIADLASTGLVAPGSRLFSTPVEVWLVQTVMVIGLCTQPQLLSKALYVEGRKNVGIMIGTAVAAAAVYALALFSGAYARLTLETGIRHDDVVAQYLATAFPWDAVGATVSVAILAASMSTLDGLIVAMSASLSGDLLGKRASITTNRIVLVLVAAATIALAINPPQLVLIFSQLGVFALIAASGGPLIAGLYCRGRLSTGSAIAAAGTGLSIHFVMELTGWNGGNPGIGASIGLVAGIVVALVLSRARSRA